MAENKKKKIKDVVAPGFTEKKNLTQTNRTAGKEGEKKTFRTSVRENEERDLPQGDRTQTIKTGQGKLVDGAPTVPNFVPAPERSTSEQVTAAIEAGNISPQAGEEILRNLETPGEAPEEKKGLLRKTAELGLKLPAAGAKLILGSDATVDEIASQTADNPIGFGLGLGVVGAGSVLAVKGAAAIGAKAGIGKAAAATGTSKVPFVGEAAIKAAGARAGLTKAGMQQVKFQLGKLRVADVANKLIASQGTTIGGYIKGSFTAKRIGGAVLLGWLGADTLAQSTSIQASTLQDNVIFGQMSKGDALTGIQKLKSYNNIGKGAVLAAAAISPAAIPFLLFGYASTKLAENQINNSEKVINSI